MQVHGPDDDKGVGNLLAKTDQNVRDEEVTQRRAHQGQHPEGAGLGVDLPLRRFLDEKLLQYQRHRRQDQGHDKGQPDPILLPKEGDHQAAQDRPQGHGDAPHQGVHRDAHRPLVPGQDSRDHAHRRRQGDGRPGQEKDSTDEHCLPEGKENDDHKAKHGDEVEEDEGLFGPQAVAEVAAGERVEGAEQIVHAVQRPDRQGSAPQGQDVDGQEALGHPLAHAHQDDHGQQGDHASLQAQELDGRLEPLAARRLFSIHVDSHLCKMLAPRHRPPLAVALNATGWGPVSGAPSYCTTGRPKQPKSPGAPVRRRARSYHVL